MFMSAIVYQSGQTAIPIDINLNAWTLQCEIASINNRMRAYLNVNSRVKSSGSMPMRTCIPANINLNESACMSADVYVAKLVYEGTNVLISRYLGITSPNHA